MKNICSILMLLVIIPCFSQSEFKLIKQIEVSSDLFTTDNQNNIYVVKGNEVTKYSKSGKVLYKYSNKNLGNITFVDASNMLRILVFYKDFSQVVFLDNTLSQNGDPINLLSLDVPQPPLVCSSYNSGMWIYDQQNFSLIRFDRDLKDIQRTGNLNQLLNDSLQPSSMLEYDNRLYVNNPRSGIMIFDIYGTYYKTIPVRNASCFQPIGEWIYYVSDKKVKAYHLKTTEEKEFAMPSDFLDFRLEMGILLLRNADTISLYSNE